MNTTVLKRNRCGDAVATATEELTSEAAQANVKPSDRPVGSTATLAEFGGRVIGPDSATLEGTDYHLVQGYRAFLLSVAYIKELIALNRDDLFANSPAAAIIAHIPGSDEYGIDAAYGDLPDSEPAEVWALPFNAEGNANAAEDPFYRIV